MEDTLSLEQSNLNLMNNESTIRNGLIFVAGNHNFSSYICTLIAKNRFRLMYIYIIVKGI